MRVENIKQTPSKEELKKQILIYLNELLTKNSDEIPNEVIRSNAKDNKFKVRKMWWQGLFGALVLVKNYYKEVPNELLKRIEVFKFKYSSDNNFDERLTTKNDIDEANQLIKDIQGELNK